MDKAYREKTRERLASGKDKPTRKPRHRKGREPLLDGMEPREYLSMRRDRSAISPLSVQLRLPLIQASEKSTLDAYAIPRAFEMQQLSNGHLTAEARIIGLLSRFIGNKIVSLACGSGWLDREIVRQREKSLYSGGELKIFGTDMSPDNIDTARQDMERMVNRNPLLRKCRDEGRFDFEYRIARLGSPISIIGKDGSPLVIPSFSHIDLSDTCIKANSPDTFIVFMAFTLWVDEREKAIMSIADKCHKKDSANPEPTYLINGEEYPTHTTPNMFMTTEFRATVESRRECEVSPSQMWETLFMKNGFREETRGLVNLGLLQDDHIMHYAAFRYSGGTNSGIRAVR